MKATGIRVGSALLVVALAWTIVGCSLTEGAASSQSAATETITVTGFGKARGNPDQATVTVGVNVADENISVAVRESNETIDRITEAIKAMGVVEKDIQTTNFSIWAEDQWDPNTGQRLDLRLYRVDSTLQINIRDIDRVGEILETSITNGANNIYGLSFGIQDPSDLADKARVAAIEDARERAELIAGAMGVTLGEVQSAMEISGGSIYPYFESAGYGMGGGGGEPPISEGSMTVNISMEVKYTITR